MWESRVEDGRVFVSLSHQTVHLPGQLCQAARNKLVLNKIHNAFLGSVCYSRLYNPAVSHNEEL